MNTGREKTKSGEMTDNRFQKIKEIKGKPRKD